MPTVDEFAAGFDEEPGYLDFARVGPIGRAVLGEQRALDEILRRARFGSLDILDRQDERVREAVAGTLGFRSDQVAFQPNTSSGLMHTMFGLTGGVAMSPAEFPSLTFAAVRAAESLHVLNPLWLEAGGPVTPGAIREQLSASCAAVALSLVDFRTGYLADLEGIRQVIGDRLLVVDAIQGFGVVDAPWEVADVIVSGGQAWVRAGWGTGFLAMSDRAVDELTPVFSGFNATEVPVPLDEVLPPRPGVGGFTISNPSPIAQAMLATALEDIGEVGVSTIGERVRANAGRIIGLADEFALPVVSARADNARAGIVVLEPAADQLTVLTAAMFNHGITATVRGGQVRFSAHVSTGDDTFEVLRDAFVSFRSATGS